jgi:hypothetical protein
VVLVAVREAGAWVVVFPAEPSEVATVAELREPDGWVRLDVEATGRVAVLLVPGSMERFVDGWSAVRDALSRGEIPGFVLDVDGRLAP